MDLRQIAHEWAHGRDKHYKNANLFARSGTIYSYGHHFPIAKFYGLNTVLFTRHGYSVSTAKHKGYVANAIPSRCKVFHVDKVCNSYSGELSKLEHKQNLDDYRSRIARAVVASKKPRIRPDTIAGHIASAERLRTEANEYRAHFKLGGKDIADVGALAETVERAQKRAAAKQKKETAARIAKRAADYADWKAGKNDQTFNEFPVAFRFRRGTDRSRIIQTSKGAEFSATEALAAYPRLQEIRTSLGGSAETIYKPDTTNPQDAPLNISGFTVEEINHDNIVIGCHTVDWKTIEDLAEKLARLKILR